MTVTVTVIFEDSDGKLLARQRFDIVNGRLLLANVASRIGAALDTLYYLDNPAWATSITARGYSERVFKDGDIVRITGTPVLPLDKYITNLVISASNALWPDHPKAH